MGEAKFTKGPWRAWPTHNAGDAPYVEAVNGGPRLCTMNGSTDEDFANARLIAAAPDLLEACKAHSAFESHTINCPDCNEWGAGNCQEGQILCVKVSGLIADAIKKATQAE